MYSSDPLPKPCCRRLLAAKAHRAVCLSLTTSEICHCIVEQRLLTSVIIYVLEEILLITLRMSHLTENLAVAADDTLDSVI